jgi:hypothetical protein
MGTKSYAMNAKLSSGYYVSSPGSSILREIYSSRANQNKAFYYILGNKTLEKRIYNFEKYGNRYNVCR